MSLALPLRPQDDGDTDASAARSDVLSTRSRRGRTYRALIAGIVAAASALILVSPSAPAQAADYTLKEGQTFYFSIPQAVRPRIPDAVLPSGAVVPLSSVTTYSSYQDFADNGDPLQNGTTIQMTATKALNGVRLLAYETDWAPAWSSPTIRVESTVVNTDITDAASIRFSSAGGLKVAASLTQSVQGNIVYAWQYRQTGTSTWRNIEGSNNTVVWGGTFDRLKFNTTFYAGVSTEVRVVVGVPYVGTKVTQTVRVR